MTDETKLHIAEADRDLAFLELTDEALGRFCRSYLINMERQLRIFAGNKSMPLDLAMGMHGSISLYRLCDKANAGDVTFNHEGVEWGGKQHGDWSITITRQPKAPPTS